MDNNQPKRRRFYKQLPELFRNAHGRVMTYWKNAMHSTHQKLSAGAAQIKKVIPFARGENWRRGDDRHHHKPK